MEEALIVSNIILLALCFYYKNKADKAQHQAFFASIALKAKE